MKVQDKKKLNAKELGEFHSRFCPYADKLYRAALIVTGNPRNALKLGAEIYMKAFREYLRAERIVNFKDWLIKIVHAHFSKAKLGKLTSWKGGDLEYGRKNLLGKISACFSN
jgi:DNA-directed RNA polymerase specialized sigma24 family protein